MSISPNVPWIRIAGRAVLYASGSVATRKFVRAIPWADDGGCGDFFSDVDVEEDDDDGRGALGKCTRIEVFSSAPVAAYVSTIARTLSGGTRDEAGTVWYRVWKTHVRE